MSLNDTIAAISTPLTKGGIGIIRISGKDSLNIAEKIFNSKLESFKSHTIRYGFIFNPESNQKVDEVLLTYMKAPRTYTKEDIIEINCHSGMAVLSKIMELILKNGARQAENGEFTKRAFLNGRIDLTQAEAVLDIINSKTEASRQNAANQLEGRLYKEIKAFMDKILSCLANIEASIDYPEHSDEIEQQFFLKTKITELLESAEALVKSADKGRIIKDGINTVIVGKTNVGKSSLLNYFTGNDRAIVTEVPGTTRDTLEESINLNGILLTLTDTAGIRETEDIVEKIGIDKAKDAAKQADLILNVFDGSQPLLGDEIMIYENIKSIALINKSDLKIKIDIEKIEKKFGAENTIITSLKDLNGLKRLEERIKQMFISGEIEGSGTTFISNIRQKDSLSRTVKSLKNCLESLEGGFPEDIVSVDLMDAYNCLGEITGESLDENLIDKIFSEFCLGK